MGFFRIRDFAKFKIFRMDSLVFRFSRIFKMVRISNFFYFFKILESLQFYNWNFLKLSNPYWLHFVNMDECIHICGLVNRTSLTITWFLINLIFPAMRSDRIDARNRANQKVENFLSGREFFLHINFFHKSGLNPETEMLNHSTPGGRQHAGLSPAPLSPSLSPRSTCFPVSGQRRLNPARCHYTYTPPPEKWTRRRWHVLGGHLVEPAPYQPRMWCQLLAAQLTVVAELVPGSPGGSSGEAEKELEYVSVDMVHLHDLRFFGPGFKK